MVFELFPGHLLRRLRFLAKHVPCLREDARALTRASGRCVAVRVIMQYVLNQLDERVRAYGTTSLWH